VRRGPAVTAAITASVVAVDQAAKFAVRANMSSSGASVPVVGDLLRITFTRNVGAAFGMLPGGRAAFIIVSVAAVCVIAGYLVRRHPVRPWLIVALGLVAGGAIGNLIDRAYFGWVTDFIQIPFDFPVFNVADASVVVGVAMLVWWLLFGPAPAAPAVPAECEAAAAAATEGGADAPSAEDAT
jgi:signal peptidase II